MKTTKSSKKNNKLIAIIGFEEGGPGQTQAWLEKYKIYHVVCFIHPENKLPKSRLYLIK